MPNTLIYFSDYRKLELLADELLDLLKRIPSVDRHNFSIQAQDTYEAKRINVEEIAREYIENLDGVINFYISPHTKNYVDGYFEIYSNDLSTIDSIKSSFDLIPFDLFLDGQLQ